MQDERAHGAPGPAFQRRAGARPGRPRPAPDGFGHLTRAAQAAPDKTGLVAATIGEIAAELRDRPVTDDLILRARLVVRVMPKS